MPCKAVQGRTRQRKALQLLRLLDCRSYQENFFKLMEIKSFHVMGPASSELIESLEGLTDDFRAKVDGFKRLIN